jgi:LacI family transcriptional regulator
MKATVSDIARTAGLSTATVDRVLNNRPGVSARNRQIVLEAARQLGYLATADSTTLPSKPGHLEFVIPSRSNAFMEELSATIADFCSRLPLVASCRIHRIERPSADEVIDALSHIGPQTSAVGVIAPDLPKTRRAVTDLADAGVRVLTIASDIPSTPRASYVGIDNRVAGRTAGYLMGRLLGGGTGRVAIVMGSRAYRGHEEREMGFRSIVVGECPGLQVGAALEVNEDSEASYRAVARLIAGDDPLLGIYCVGAGRRGVVRAVRERSGTGKPIVICHDLTDETRRNLLEESVDAVIDQNARLMAEQSVIAMLGSLASAAPYLTRKFVEPRIILRENIPVR